MNIRTATDEDVSRMVELSNIKRTEYAQYSPVFWRKAEGAADKQALFFRDQLRREQNIVLVCEESGQMAGFLIASVVGAPPVYDPGGLVCMVDDFAVSCPALWSTVGRLLLAQAKTQAQARGAVLSIVVCGHLDEPKRKMLQDMSATIASEWYVVPIP